MTGKMVKSRKAISPILATLLLVVIAVAAIVVTYAWVMTYMGNTTRPLGENLYLLNTRFYNDTDVKKIEMTVGNSGESEARITQAYVGRSASTLQNQTIAPVTILAGSSELITVTYDWTPSVAYYFKVFSASGRFLEWQAPAPPEA